jgi:hypothetical protein
MLSLKLVKLIETHSDQLAHGLCEKLRRSEKTSDFSRVPGDELEAAAFDVYRHLGEWLLTKTETDVELRYKEIGAWRAAQGVSLTQWVWAILLTKEHLWGFLQRESLVDRPFEVYGELELLRLLDQFFDRAIYYGLLGYQRHASLREAA